MLPMSSGAGEITHTSDLTSVKYLTAVKRRLREKKYVLGCFYTFFNYVFNNGNKIFETGTADSEMLLKLSVG
jgi:hypothetical protein